MTLLQLQDHQIEALRQPRRLRYPSGAMAWATQHRQPILAVTGMAAEARLAAGPGVTTVMAGGNPARLPALLRARIQPDCRALITIGIAGGLDPSLASGHVNRANGVPAPDRRYAPSPV